jgi:acetyltransferase-like isoleucine patch superfamily enzyme
VDLNRLLKLRRAFVAVKRAYWVRVYGMDLHPTVQFSLSAYLDRTYPRGIHVGAHTWIALKSIVLSHDRVRGLYVHTRIGENCFIGAGSIVMPGVQIGNGVVVAAGAVVVSNVPDTCVVAGNPAKVVREDIKVGKFGRFKGADEIELAIRASSDFEGREWR